MSTSVAELNRRTSKRYMLLVLFCCLFAAVYEMFSHHVISLWMVCLPLFPMILGVIPFLALKRSIPDGWARQFWHCGIATIIVGSCLTGIFEIAGIHMPYTFIFLLTGCLLILLACVAYILLRMKTSSDV